MLGKTSKYSEEKVKTTLTLTPTAREWLTREAKRVGADSVSDYLEQLARGFVGQDSSKAA